MTTITLLPKTFAENILPRLTTQETIAFSRVSKQAQWLLASVASVSNEDIDLEGNRMTSIPGTIPSLLRQKWKMEIFTTRPELLGQLCKVRARVDVPKGDPCAIMAWHETKKQCLGTEPMLAIIALDFKEGKLKGESLRNGLGRAVNEKHRELLRTVLTHPNVETISEDGFYNNASEAILLGYPEFLRMILLHPAAAKIPAEGHFGLGKLLTQVAEKGSEEMVTSVLSHPNAKDIPANGNYSLGGLLVSTLYREGATLQEVQWILSLPNAKNIDAKNGYPLGIILTGAVNTQNPKIVREVLIFFNGVHIPVLGFASIESCLNTANRHNSSEIIVEITLHTKIEEWSRDMLSIGLTAALKTDSSLLVKMVLLQIKSSFGEEAYIRAFEDIRRTNGRMIAEIFLDLLTISKNL